MAFDMKPRSPRQRRTFSNPQHARSAPRRINHAVRRTQTSWLRKLLFVVACAFLLLLGTSSISPLLWPSRSAESDTSLPSEPVDVLLLPSVTPAPAAVEAVNVPPSAKPSVPAVTPEPEPAAERTTPERTTPERTTPERTDKDIAAAIDLYINSLVTEGAFNGTILVAREGDILLSKGYGMADWEKGIPNTPQTRFRLASLTKSFTAMSVLILHTQGSLSIHDPICLYLEDCPETWQPITIRHLLSHTSGIPNYTDFIDYETTEMNRVSPEELIARFKDEPLIFPPGDMYGYCNSGYVLLGIIIERVSGQSYEDFLRAHIFEPLQMDNTGYDHNNHVIVDQAQGYRTPKTLAPFLDTSTLHAAGSLYSTAEDMYRWDQALYTEQLIPRALLDEMFTPVHYGYGYGWRIDTLSARLSMSHSGFMTGFSNYIARYPKERVLILVLSNLEISNSRGISQKIAQIIFEPPVPPASPMPDGDKEE